MALLVVIGVCVALGLIFSIVEKAATIRKNKAADLAERESKLAKERESFEKYRTAAQNGIEALAKEKALGFPWLARAYAEYFEILDGRVARNLETKKHPARKAADAIRAVGREKQRCDVKTRSCASFTDITNIKFRG